jgi:D-alanine-D-alanine ligase
MLVGLTYDLRDDYLAQGYGKEETAELDKADTIDGIDQALRSLGYNIRRIGNVRTLVELLAAGERWDLVFNIAEGLHGIARESQVPALLDAYRISYTFSDPTVLGVTLHKGMTKRLVRDMGIPTPDFAVIEKEEDLQGLSLPYPLFAKPVAEGTSKGISPLSLIHDQSRLHAACRDILERFRQPVLLETYLPGREFTVGIVGTGEKARAIGALEVLMLDKAEMQAYSYLNKADFEERIKYVLAEDETARQAIGIALRSWVGLGCRDCGRIDLRCDARGVPNFMEVNPLAGLNPDISDLPILCRQKGISFRDLIGMIMESALERVPAAGGSAVQAPSLALVP